MLMKGTVLSRLSDRYLAALRIHLERGPQPSMRSAHELGSQALALGLETLDLAKMHDLAVAALSASDHAAFARGNANAQAVSFFTEANTPIERTHRMALDAAADLKRLNATLARHALHLADSHRDLKIHTEKRRSTEAALRTSRRASTQLLKESRLLEKHLSDMTRGIFAANEEERRKMSVQLQDEIAQTLLGIHVRLLALKTEAAANHAGLTSEIATTQQLVESSVETINRFIGEFGIQHEN